MDDDKCETCNRWFECNGVDKDNCPLWNVKGKENAQEQPKENSCGL